jgi:hypothetical protein
MLEWMLIAAFAMMMPVAYSIFILVRDTELDAEDADGEI